MPRQIEENIAIRRHRSVSYAKWGYLFIAPFFIVYILCTLIPQFLTVYNSFFESYMDGLKQVGPNYVGIKNYIALFTPDSTGVIGIIKYTQNTLIIWILGAVPQFVIAMLLALFFTSYRLNIKGQPFFKSVIYLPNLIMASAFAMLFFTLFSNVGPVNQLLLQTGIIDQTFDFFRSKVSVRLLIALMNFLMWFGNTTILFMAGIMGIDQELFESATIDGANSTQVFFRITLPLLMPIVVYAIITAMIGGLQMFDVPQVLTNRLGNPDRTALTLVMYLNSYLTPSKNYGMSGAVSMYLFIITAFLSMIVYRSMIRQGTSSRR
jgi:cellobiose transport system permease protein